MVSTANFRPPIQPLRDVVVLVRPVDERDCEIIEAAASVRDIVWAFGGPNTATEEPGFHRRRWQEEAAGAFAICPSDDTFVGVVLLEVRPQSRADIGYWVLPGQRGRGYAYRATRLVATWALREAGIARVQLWATPDNQVSQRVAELSGFRLEEFEAVATGLEAGTRSVARGVAAEADVTVALLLVLRRNDAGFPVHWRHQQRPSLDPARGSRELVPLEEADVPARRPTRPYTRSHAATHPPERTVACRQVDARPSLPRRASGHIAP